MIPLNERKKAYLVLEDGLVLEGKSFGALGETFGEAVFATAMTGYQETLTDPSYHKQVVIMTAPHIGNTGMNKADEESNRIWVSGYVVRNPSPVASNWRSEKTLESELIRYGVVGISHIDTRAITKHLRNLGAMRVGIFSDTSLSRDEMIVAVRKSPLMLGANLVADVTTKDLVKLSPKFMEQNSYKKMKVAALDLGIKGATPRMMNERNMEVNLVPAHISINEIKEMKIDGFFLSNGPGDPGTMDEMVELVRNLIWEQIPIFGICFGHQIIGRALGFETYKLKFGHRGINQPVKNLKTGRVEITAHNHGFAVAAPLEGKFNTAFGTGMVSHVNLNDQVVEGLSMEEISVFSVQYHPESAAGPHDSTYLFDNFYNAMLQKNTGIQGNLESLQTSESKN